MWAFTILAFSIAVVGIFSVLNNSFSSKLQDSRMDAAAAKFMNEHYCAVRGNCVDGYKPDPNFVITRGNAIYVWTRTVEPYAPSQGYLAALLDKTKHSYLCVTQKSAGVFVRQPGSSPAACEDTFPAAIQTAERTSPEGVILVYQKR